MVPSAQLGAQQKQTASELASPTCLIRKVTILCPPQLGAQQKQTASELASLDRSNRQARHLPN